MTDHTMSEDNSKSVTSPLNLELSARAQAKIEIKAEIPRESTGRLVDALTDIIRPFSEKRGLKADILRLQREEVLIQIGQLARQRALEENVAPNPLPNKFLVPFLEKSSTEEVDSELVERWANLLLSASKNFNSRYILYTNILSNLGPEDVKFLDGMVKENRGTSSIAGYARHFDETPGLFSLEEIKERFESSFDDDLHTDEETMLAIINEFEWPGVYFRYIEFLDQNDKHRSISKAGAGFPHSEQFPISALESQGLIRTYGIRPRNTLSNVEICAITYLGSDFYKACTKGGRKQAG
jgi:hypothetical protein